MTHCNIIPSMTYRTLVASTATIATIPIVIGILAWHGALRHSDLELDFDPGEIDLQLRDRNDDPVV